MPDNIAAPKVFHAVQIDGRAKLTATGIAEVTSYDSDTIVAASDAGEVIIQGKKLHIISFDRVSGKLILEGTVDAVQYVDVKPKNQSFFSRLLK